MEALLDDFIRSAAVVRAFKQNKHLAAVKGIIEFLRVVARNEGIFLAMDEANTLLESVLAQLQHLLLDVHFLDLQS